MSGESLNIQTHSSPRKGRHRVGGVGREALFEDVGTAVVTQGEWKRPRTDPYAKKKEEKKATRRDAERWLGLWARHVSLSFALGGESQGLIHVSSVLQITSFRYFVPRMSTFPEYISVPACLAICPHAPFIPK